MTVGRVVHDRAYAGAMLRTLLTPGVQTPRRSVPPEIERPEYVDRDRPAPNTETTWVQTAETIEKMRIASQIAAAAMLEGSKVIAPGVTTDAVDKVVHEYICDHGAYPSTLGYRHFPKSCCTSLNEVICHGIPDSTVIEDGDIVNIDVTAYIHGVHGDTNATYLSGNVSEENRLLVERTEETLRRAIKAVVPGRKLNVIGRVIESYAKRFGYGVVRDYTGHGIGHTFHSGLVILHYDNPDVDTVIEKGMTFTIEPMITLGGVDWDLWDDDWTVTTKDRSWTAQFEHTLLVTDTGAEILTLP
jgi:methionyl aminopeptidase